MSRAVMQQALEALEWGSGTYDRRNAAITALKQALAEPEQKPVAWMCPDDPDRATAFAWSYGYCIDCGKPRIPLYTAPTPQREHITDGSPCWCNPDVIEEDGGNVIVHNYEDNWQQYAKPGETAQQCIERHRAEQDALMKLYATPRKPQTTHWEGCEAVHPECRKQEQEPIGHADFGINNIYIFSESEPRVVPAGRTPLYIAPTPQPDTDCHAQGICQRSGYSITPTPRRPLTDEEIDAVYIGCKHGSINEFARAIERAHGITGERHE